MRRQVLLPELGRMFGPTGFWASAPARAYTAAGSFILWLQQSQGTERLRRLLAHGQFAQVYGRSLESLVTEWERMLDGIPLDEGAVNRAFARFREPSLFHRPCAREVAGLRASARAISTADPSQALRLLHRCAELQPEEVEPLLAEATLLHRLNRNAEAAAALDRAESRVAGHPALEALVALGRADLAWGTGDLQAAGVALEQARALHPGLDLERQVEVKRTALADGRIAPAVHAYLEPPSEDLRLWALEQARQAVPDSPVVNYLLGRRLLALGQPVEAAQSLQRALAQTLPDSIAREAWRLVVSAHYQAGDCAAVRTDLGRMPDLGPALRAEVTEWQGRCDFEGRLFNGALVPRGAFR
jgi:tetratricopeptide (TPR) repeat protein